MKIEINVCNLNLTLLLTLLTRVWSKDLKIAYFDSIYLKQFQAYGCSIDVVQNFTRFFCCYNLVGAFKCAFFDNLKVSYSFLSKTIMTYCVVSEAISSSWSFTWCCAKFYESFGLLQNLQALHKRKAQKSLCWQTVL